MRFKDIIRKINSVSIFGFGFGWGNQNTNDMPIIILEAGEIRPNREEFVIRIENKGGVAGTVCKVIVNGNPAAFSRADVLGAGEKKELYVHDIHQLSIEGVNRIEVSYEDPLGKVNKISGKYNYITSSRVGGLLQK